MLLIKNGDNMADAKFEYFEYTGKTIEIDGCLLRQIRAKKSFLCGREQIEAGKTGGFISQNIVIKGKSWINEKSIVYSKKLSEARIVDSLIQNSTICDSLMINNSVIMDSTITDSVIEEKVCVKNSKISGASIFGTISIFDTQINKSYIKGDGIFFLNSEIKTTKIENKSNIKTFTKDGILAFLNNSKISGGDPEKWGKQFVEIYFDNKPNWNTSNEIVDTTIHGNVKIYGCMKIFESKIIDDVALCGELYIKKCLLFENFSKGITISGKKVLALQKYELTEVSSSQTGLEEFFIEIPDETKSYISFSAKIDSGSFCSGTKRNLDTEDEIFEYVKNACETTSNKRVKYLLSKQFIEDQIAIIEDTTKEVLLPFAAMTAFYSAIAIQFAIITIINKIDADMFLNTILDGKPFDISTKDYAIKKILFLKSEVIDALKEYDIKIEEEEKNIVSILEKSDWKQIVKHLADK